MRQPQPAPQQNRRKFALIVTGATVAAFTLGGGLALLLKDDGQTTDAAPVKKAATTPPSTPATSPTKKTADLKIGDTAEITSDVDSSAAALNYKDENIEGIQELLGAGQKWAVAEVKVCNRGAEAFSVSTFVWSLAYEDGARVEPAGTNAGELPQPIYPMDAKVSGGDCVRGNIAFQVPEEGRPERVLYSPDSLDEPVEWQVGK